MKSLQRWSGNLTIRNKFRVLGLGLSLPFLLMLTLALLTYQSVTTEAAKTLELGRRGDEALVNGSKIDLLLLIQNTLQSLSIQAADPPGGVADPTLFEDAQRWFDLAEKEWQVLETSGPLAIRSTWNEFQTGLLQTLPRLLNDRLATRQKFDEAFQKLQGLTEHYQGRLTPLAPPSLVLVQTQAFYAVLSVLQSRNSPYLQERPLTEWKVTRAHWWGQLPPQGPYRTLALEYLAVIDAELIPTLEAWIAERARIDLLLLKYHHDQTKRSQAVAAHFSDEKKKYLDAIRSGLADRTESQATLQNQSLAWLAGLGILGLGGGFLLYWLLRLFERGLVAPLTEATEWATRIRNGDYGARLQTLRNDELGVLSSTLEHMALEVIQKTREAETLNRNLEATVEQRTEHLAQALKDLEEAQAKVVSSEKLAVIGKLAAGMAHELNTPLAAVISADRSILEFLQTGAPPALNLYEGLTQAEKDLLVTATAVATRRLAEGSHRHRREEFRRLSQELEGWGVTDASAQAEAWIELGLATSTDLQRTWAPHPRTTAILELALELSNVQHMAQIILTAAEQAAGVVQSLRQYISEGRQEEPRWFPLQESLETVLQLIGHRRLKEVELHWEIDRSLQVWGPVGALNQVWINLITNALQAMQYRGQLTLGAKSVADEWVVHVGDTGPGIPPEIGDRIFEPFFTSKRDQGGMGLGLDICRRLVETLGGRLTFQSVPGNTVFEVRWPRPLEVSARM